MFGGKKVSDDEKDAKVNWLTGESYSPAYFDLLKTRKTLPAWASKEKVIEAVRENQVVVL